MSFKAGVCAMEYHNIDGAGWPDAVVVDNGGDVFEHTYAIRTYYPVNRDALLALADEMTVEKGDIWRWSSRIREALGVNHG